MASSSQRPEAAGSESGTRLMSSESTITDRFVAQYGALKPALPGARLGWLATLREAALARFAASGLPTPKVEAWKYTNLNPLAKLALVPAAPVRNGITAEALPWLLPHTAKPHRLVFMNGRLRPDLSMLGTLPKGATLMGLAAMLERDPEALEGRLGGLGAIEQPPLVALNTAFLADGFALRLGRDVVLDRPVELLFIGMPGAEPVAYHPRGLVLAEPGSRATIVEQHVGVGAGVYFANGVIEIELEDGASLAHYKLEGEGTQAFHIATSQVRLGRGARYESFVLAQGGRLARNEINVTLDGPGASCRLNGAYMGRARQHIDNTTMIDHAKPETTSREVYKGVLDNYARGVFQGRILVRPDAQKADGHQMSRTLLLSEGAEIDTKPQLEIYADDVKCSHGAAAGALDEAALFYLRSRGIPQEEARLLLVAAFVHDVVDEIENESVREIFRRVAAGWVAPKNVE